MLEFNHSAVRDNKHQCLLLYFVSVIFALKSGAGWPQNPIPDFVEEDRIQICGCLFHWEALEADIQQVLHHLVPCLQECSH